jgi:hypothetical protein
MAGHRLGNRVRLLGVCNRKSISWASAGMRCVQRNGEVDDRIHFTRNGGGKSRQPRNWKRKRRRYYLKVARHDIYCGIPGAGASVRARI